MSSSVFDIPSGVESFQGPSQAQSRGSSSFQPSSSFQGSPSKEELLKGKKVLTKDQYYAAMDLKEHLKKCKPYTKNLLLNNKELSYDLIKIALTDAAPRFIS